MRYEAEFSTETGESTITVRGRNYEYTMSGDLEGLVTVWEAPAN